MKSLVSSLAGGVLAMVLAVNAVGQEPLPDSGVGTAPTTTNRTDTGTATNRFDDDNDDDGFNPGWLGLLGLIGLAGLMPRDRRDRHVHTHGVGASTTGARTV